MISDVESVKNDLKNTVQRSHITHLVVHNHNGHKAARNVKK